MGFVKKKNPKNLGFEGRAYKIRRGLNFFIVFYRKKSKITLKFEIYKKITITFFVVK